MCRLRFSGGRSWPALAVLAALVPAGAGLAQDAAGSGYRIGARDVLSIRVVELPEISGEEGRVTVAEDGTIDLPVLGNVRALGFTTGELAADLEQQLEARFVRQATVSVRLAEYQVSVLGAVAKPGNIQVPGRGTLIEVLVSAGGVSTENAGVVRVRRQARNGLSDQVEISIDDLIGRGDPNVDIPIIAGDLINVPAAAKRTVHVLGEVEQPGSLTFSSGERATLLTAIARAGGLTDTAAKSIRIQHRPGSAGASEIEVNFRRVLDGKEADPELADGDIVIVKESFF